MIHSKRIVVAMTGASGMPYAAALLRALADAPDVEPHLIVSDAARKVWELEADTPFDALAGLAVRTYAQNEIGASPASGSWRHHGMVVIPCTMASLAAIANGLGSNLIHRAADVTLKERRKLVLVTRETPLNRVHIANMLAATDAGAIIVPASPGFYHKPATIHDLVRHFTGRILDLLDIPNTLTTRWEG
ncbi:MAG: UbiX family flavin prenyltransferase [Desulfovibrionaceae bacterium]